MKQAIPPLLLYNDTRFTRVSSRNLYASFYPTEALVEFIASGLFGMMKGWLGGKARLSVAELNALFRWLAIPAVKSRSRRARFLSWQNIAISLIEAFLPSIRS